MQPDLQMNQQENMVQQVYDLENIAPLWSFDLEQPATHSDVSVHVPVSLLPTLMVSESVVSPAISPSSMSINFPVRKMDLPDTAGAGPLTEETTDTMDCKELDEDDDSRGVGIINFTVPDVRQLNDTGMKSDPVYIRNAAWRILVMKRRISNPVVHRNEPALAYFVQCEMFPCSAWWTCRTRAQLRIRPWKTETPLVEKEFTCTLSEKSDDRGFGGFITFQRLTDPVEGYINPNDHSLKLQVRVQADAPHNVCWDSKKDAGYVGLENQLATCYMNALLQSLFFVNKLRKAVYLIPTEGADPVRNVALALQRVFYELQNSSTSVGTKKLTASFGWRNSETSTHHDVQEFCRLFLDQLDGQMASTRVEGTIPNLLQGTMITYIRCKNVDYETSRKESFMDIQLNVKGKKNVYDSFDDYVASEALDGDNRYDAGDHGLQEAEKGIYFESFPPVFHLQLKRVQYDPVSGGNKITDRFEFPEILDLRKYLKSPALIEPVYFLHAVLVHDGYSNDGGHYVVYIDPEGDGKWCNFDDTVVGKCTKNDVFERNYGGVDIPVTAYMLVYINEKMRGEILQPVTDTDVPGYLQKFFAKECDVELRREKETSKYGMLNVHIVTEDDFAAHQGHELVDFNNVMLGKSFPIHRATNFAGLCQTVSGWLGYIPKDVRCWIFRVRPNKSLRPLLPGQGNDPRNYSVQRLADMLTPDSIRSEDIVLFVESLPYRNLNSGLNVKEISNFRQQNQIFIFFRLYDPVRRTLEYKGYDVFPTNLQFDNLIKACNRKAGFPTETELTMFNDIRAGVLHRLVAGKSAQGTGWQSQQPLDLKDGDLIVFQRAIAKGQEGTLQALATVTEYFKDLTTYRVYIEFFDKERPKERLGVFTLPLNWKMPYSHVVHAVAAKLKIDFKRVQLYRYEGFDTLGAAVPFGSQLILSDIITSRFMSKPKKLFYRILDMDIDEFESRKNVKVIWQRNCRDEGREIVLSVNKHGRVSDLLDKARKLIEITLGGSGQLRVVELTAAGTRIISTVDPSVLLDNIPGNRMFRIEEIPLDQMTLGSDEVLMPAAHFNKEKFPTFGVPFYMKIRVGEQFVGIRERIRILLGVDATAFEKYKFCIFHPGVQIYLEDDQNIGQTVLNPQGTYTGITASTVWVGIDHPDKRQNQNHAPQKPLILPSLE